MQPSDESFNSGSQTQLAPWATCKVTRGPHYDAVATTAVPELTRNSGNQRHSSYMLLWPYPAEFSKFRTAYLKLV